MENNASSALREVLRTGPSIPEDNREASRNGILMQRLQMELSLVEVEADARKSR